MNTALFITCSDFIRSIPFLAVTRSEKSKDRGRWRPSCGLYGTWPSTTIVSVTLTAVSGPCAPDNQHSTVTKSLSHSAGPERVQNT